MAEGFRGVIALLDRIGVYDIVLPFLLVFTIMFAIILGVGAALIRRFISNLRKKLIVKS